MDKRFIGILVLIVGVFGLMVFSGNKKNDSNKIDVTPTNNVIGGGNKKVTLTEYGDFQCPVCYRYHEAITQVREKYKDDIVFQFRNFPIVSAHKNAMAAHKAAFAAGVQGKFWEMFELIYSRNPLWSESSDPVTIFNGYAKELGLDEAKFKTDYSSQSTNDTILADVAEGQKQGVSGTPTFFINGKKIDNPNNTLEDFSVVLDKAIAEANPTATAPEEVPAETPAVTNP